MSFCALFKDLPMTSSVIYYIAVCVNKMFDYYGSVCFGIILRLSEKYVADYRIPEHYFCRLHGHLPVGMGHIKRERATNPWNHAFVVSLIVSKHKMLFVYH